MCGYLHFTDWILKIENTLWDIGWSVGSSHDTMISIFVKDYDDFYVIEEQTISEQIHKAEYFVKQIQAYLKIL